MCVFTLTNGLYIKNEAGPKSLSVVPPAWVGGAAVLQDIVGAQRHDGPHIALQALLWLDEHRVARLSEVVSDHRATHLEGGPAHRRLAVRLCHDI